MGFAVFAECLFYLARVAVGGSFLRLVGEEPSLCFLDKFVDLAPVLDMGELDGTAVLGPCLEASFMCLDTTNGLNGDGYFETSFGLDQSSAVEVVMLVLYEGEGDDGHDQGPEEQDGYDPCDAVGLGEFDEIGSYWFSCGVGDLLSLSPGLSGNYLGGVVTSSSGESWVGTWGRE